MQSISALLLLSLPSLVAPEQPITLPEKIEGKPGRYIAIDPECDPGLVVCWIYPDHCEPAPFELRDPQVLAVITDFRGEFRVGAYSAFIGPDGRAVPTPPVWTTVVTGTAPPPEPGPGPGPTPPPDQLSQSLRQIYTADPSAAKATHLKALTSVYSSMVAEAGQPPLATTVGDLYQTLVRRVSAVVPAEALREIRRRVAEEVATHLPSDPKTPLTPGLRTTAAELFGRVASALQYAGGE